MDVSLRVERRDELAASKKAAPGIDSVGIGSIAGTSISTCSVVQRVASLVKQDGRKIQEI